MLCIPDHITREVQRLKSHFPFRIVWCAVKDGTWVTGANVTMRQANDHARKGWRVYVSAAQFPKS